MTSTSTSTFDDAPAVRQGHQEHVPCIHIPNAVTLLSNDEGQVAGHRALAATQAEFDALGRDVHRLAQLVCLGSQPACESSAGSHCAGEVSQTRVNGVAAVRQIPGDSLFNTSVLDASVSTWRSTTTASQLLGAHPIKSCRSKGKTKTKTKTEISIEHGRLASHLDSTLRSQSNIDLAALALRCPKTCGEQLLRQAREHIERSIFRSCGVVSKHEHGHRHVTAMDTDTVARVDK